MVDPIESVVYECRGEEYRVGPLCGEYRSWPSALMSILWVDSFSGPSTSMTLSGPFLTPLVSVVVCRRHGKTHIADPLGEA